MGDLARYWTDGDLSSGILTAGVQYWFAANVIGLTADARIKVGGHTQNSGGINDNGTFWFSNDPTGINFDGQGLTPEMAFRVELEPVPEPTTLLLPGIDPAGRGIARRRLHQPSGYKGNGCGRW
jgi:hypothetical protein